MDDVIYRHVLRDAMYHEAFEVDSDLQKWDGGCWIRYKMFENVIDDVPSVDAVEVVRCGECKHMSPVGVCTYFADSSVRPSASDFCSYGERKTDG